MADLKYHWAIPVSDPSKHRRSWKGYAGLHYVQACGRAYRGSTYAESAAVYVSYVTKDPDWYCSDCAKAARLALAKESAPKPADVVWPKPRPISEAPKDGPEIMGWCPGYGWRHLYLDLTDAWVAVGTPHRYQPTHFLPLPPSPEVK